MADSVLTPRAHPLAAVTAIKHSALTLAPLPAAARLALRIDAGAQAEAGHIDEFPLGGAINTWTAGDADTRVLRLGPDEWLVLAPDGAAEALAARLGEALTGRQHAIVDVSHRYAALEIAGPAAADVINAGCPLDLHSSHFAVGTATRTHLAKAEIILQATDDRPGFRIEVARSFAGYTWAFLAEAAREFVSR